MGVIKVMKIYRGWYRKSLSRKNAVWHRVHYTGSVPVPVPVETTLFPYGMTVCGRRMPTTDCDFSVRPKNKCMQCEKSPWLIMETDHRFVPIANTPKSTRAAAIAELRRLLKPQTHYLRIFGNEGVRITAKWESDTSVSIYTDTETITKKRTKRVMTLTQIQASLNLFKSDIDCLCNTSDALALAEKRKKKLKGRLTAGESYAYFEKLLHVAELNIIGTKRSRPR
jgi:hypothetical protein